MEKQLQKTDKTAQNLTSKGKVNYSKILEYLSDPDLDWPKRSEYSTKILKYSKSTQLYQTLSPVVLEEIEAQAFENRKKKSARQRAMVRAALFKKAIGYVLKETKVFKTSNDGIITKTIEKHYPPDPVAAREFLDRTEGKVTEKHEIEHSVSELTDEELDAQIVELLSENDNLRSIVMGLTGRDGNST